ncbi:MAG: DUF4270 family protein [Lutibacter sp.]|uniref:DUF4270 domain-containing protein n=1 Tax=Lutibacter sp. TaxID=1925666 RepID=UPI0019F8C62D|nr:DUF4270 domain-containing protein [Lutibacter sp.]NOR28599.1 DUF4270 family protein [Lutibacter sp.]
MTTKVVKVLKYLSLYSTVFFTIISCEKEIESIGVNLVDNNNFSNSTLTTEVIAANENVERVITNGVSQYLLGVYSDTEFGKLKASIVSQLSLPATGDDYNYGTNAAIDSVLINIPYQSTREENESDGKPKFSIDSVFGDRDVEFQLTVFELNTFLNTLNPEDPTKNAVYYSDKDFLKVETPLFSENFKINPSDTVSVIKRYLADGITIYDKDTIKQTDLSPSINIPLNEGMIQQLFVNNAGDADFSSIDNFQHFFRGFYIQAEELTNEESHLLSLSITNSKMTIYYSNDEDEGEDTTDAGIDLNDNGIKGEGIVRMKHEYVFPFGSINANKFERDNSNTKESGEDRLYVQGAAGSIATIDLLGSEDLSEYQSENSEKLLVTGANLIFYVDQSATNSAIAPEQLFLYNYDDNEQILDVMTEGVLAVGGFLERDEAGEPYRYVFNITDYISELLKHDDHLDLVKLGLKVYNPTDTPVSFTDLTIKDYSWTPKGVVLFDQNEIHGDKRVKFEILFSKIGN